MSGGIAAVKDIFGSIISFDESDHFQAVKDMTDHMEKHQS